MSRRYSKRSYARASSGQSIVEFAVAVGVLTLLLVVVADFARVFYESVGLYNAARAGAQYGSQSVITAADLNGMKAAATLDGANVASLTPTASQCTCESGSSVASCPSELLQRQPHGYFRRSRYLRAVQNHRELSRSSEFTDLNR